MHGRTSTFVYTLLSSLNQSIKPAANFPAAKRGRRNRKYKNSSGTVSMLFFHFIRTSCKMLSLSNRTPMHLQPFSLPPVFPLPPVTQWGHADQMYIYPFLHILMHMRASQYVCNGPLLLVPRTPASSCMNLCA